MTLSSLITSDVTNVFGNTDDFAEDVTQWPLGVSANAATVEGCNFQEGTGASEEPRRDLSRGEEVAHHARLYVPSTTSTDEKDVWVVNSVQWQATAVGPTEGGMTTVHLKRNDRERMTGRGRGRHA